MDRGSLLLAVGAALWLGGCATHSVTERVALAGRIAGEHAFVQLDIKAGRFHLRSFLGPQGGRDVLHVYIEGDGFAWVTRSRPSANPTPVSPVALKLAVQDAHDVAYLARPCQYVPVQGDECSQRYWTRARFGQEVVDAMDDAITQLKEKSGHARVVLIGYSGGGAIATLVAAGRTDVQQLVTVAGNLDHRAWTRLHGIAPLRDSLNPPDYARTLARVRQTHIVGESDFVVPIDVYRSYRRALPDSGDITLRVVPQAHDCCWEKVWPALLSEIQDRRDPVDLPTTP
jgi:pimeloyl-ACP methyl ester carboxylesterase